jgi:hypothetical protein
LRDRPRAAGPHRKSQPVFALRAVIARYCGGCHNDKAKASGVASSNLNPESAGERPELWDKIVRKMHVRSCRPTVCPTRRADVRNYDATDGSIGAALDRAAAAKAHMGRNGQLEFRAEGFNLFNTPLFQGVSRTLGSATFGRVSLNTSANSRFA